MKKPALFLILLLSAPWGLAADAPAEPVDAEDQAAAEEAAEAPERQEDEAGAATGQTGEEGRSGAVTTDDTFVPSVQISEDLSVSFPMDI